jgi:hypothetical protein
VVQRAILVLFAAGLFASLFWFVHPWYDLTADGSIYIVTGRSLAAGEGYRYLGEPFQVRPPGFPLLIAPFVRGLENGSFAINFFVACFGAAGVLLLFCHARPRLGFILALLVAAAIWLNPNYQRLSTQVMSDVPGTTLLLLCLLLERWASAKPSRQREVVLGAAIGLSAWVRMTAILLVPAIFFSRLLRARPPGVPTDTRGWTAARAGEHLLVFAGVALLVLAPWPIRNHLDPAPSPAEQTLLYSYSVANRHVDPGDPDSELLPWSAILGRIPLRSRQILTVLGNRLEEASFAEMEPEGPVEIANAAVALLLLGSSLLLLAKRREPAEFFMFILLAVTATYFGFTPRLVLPLYLLTLPAAAEVVRDLTARAAGARVATPLVAALLLVLIGIDFSPRRHWDLIEQQHREYAELARAVNAAVEPDARLGAVSGSHYSVFLERPVYSIQFLVRRKQSLEAAEDVIERDRLDAIVLSDRTPLDRQFAEYFGQRLGPPERAGPALIFRLAQAAPRVETNR